jgi:hypothetical protein
MGMTWVIERAASCELLDIGPDLRLARLDPERAKRFWAGMQTHDPGMAEIVAEVGPQLRDLFDAQLTVTDEQARRFMGKNDG